MCTISYLSHVLSLAMVVTSFMVRCDDPDSDKETSAGMKLWNYPRSRGLLVCVICLTRFHGEADPTATTTGLATDPGPIAETDPGSMRGPTGVPGSVT